MGVILRHMALTTMARKFALDLCIYTHCTIGPLLFHW